MNTEPDDEEVIYNILRNRIPDYNANAMFGESHNFCDIGRYEDMPGEEEIANILNSMSRETLNKYFSNNPDDLMLFHMMRNKYSDIMPLVDEKYLEAIYIVYSNGHFNLMLEWLNGNLEISEKDIIELENKMFNIFPTVYDKDITR